MTRTVRLTAIDKTVEVLKSALDKIFEVISTVDVELFDGTIAHVEAYDSYDGKYYSVEGTEEPWAGSRELTKVADFLVNYEDKLNARNTEISELRAFKAKMDAETDAEVKSEMFDFYSDWHKDVYGYRPR